MVKKQLQTDINESLMESYCDLFCICNENCYTNNAQTTREYLLTFLTSFLPLYEAHASPRGYTRVCVYQNGLIAHNYMQQSDKERL